MFLHYKNQDGRTEKYELKEHPITIGRSPDTDLCIDDEKASRTHTGIRFQNGHYYVQDLKSKNGTFVNGKQIDSSTRLHLNDQIRIGSVIFLFEKGSLKGTTTALFEMEKEMSDGKGYGTILKEIVEEVNESPPGRNH